MSHTPAWELSGWFAERAGDVNGDGFADLIARSGDLPEVRVYLGSSRGPQDEPVWSVELKMLDCRSCVAGAAGDVDGDGLDDIAVGGSFEGPAGRIRVFRGRRDGPPVIGWTLDGIESCGPSRVSSFGSNVVSPGDVNGDAYDDLIVFAIACNSDDSAALAYLGSRDGLSSTPSWIGTDRRTCESPRSRFEPSGLSGEPANDENGDGFADVVVVGFGFRECRGQSILYEGSPDGLSAEPAWRVGLGDAGIDQGWDIVGVDDVDADGFSDVLVVGRPSGDAPEGVFVYPGSPNGLSRDASWALEAPLLSTRPGAVGDANCDGVSDVAVKQWESGRSRLMLFAGSPEGLSPKPVWVVEGEDLGAVEPAGDVNGDGCDDFLIQTLLSDEHDRPFSALYLGGPTPR